MNVIEISCPAKTFIIGEYAVLDKGPAIVLNTSPRFICRVQKTSSGNEIDLSENSPAGQWIRKHPQDFQSVQLEWLNNNKVKGGLGFSSAQFNILYAYSFILREGHIDQITPQEIWRNYRNLKFNGFIPSGADVITQWVGGVTVFEQSPLSIETLTSSLPDLECLVLRTGDYFETYKYLKNFELGDVSDLKKISQSAVSAMREKDEASFICAINDYRSALKRKNYITAKSEEILNRLEKVKAIKAIKACGAMGAETLIVFYHRQDEEEVINEVSFLETVATAKQITYGVNFNKITKRSEVFN
ncbi:MAG: hypothetical protein OXC37_06515 [Bdellovibrionaceae bacterium]|nr:hypothetical protein [Pseudobdellovibrionaceae bacterium]